MFKNYFLCAALSCSFLMSKEAACAPEKQKEIRLALIVVADQMPAEYLTRFRPYLTGGLARLLQEGKIFTEAHHDHATTSTCAGHAAISTGRHPKHTGIVQNSWFDQTTKRITYCVDDPQFQSSPRKLHTSGLADWIQSQSSAAKTYAVSAKDRASIMLGGHQPTAAFWYNKNEGDFRSSSYYTNVNPPWLIDFNAKKNALMAQLSGTVWNSLPLIGINLASIKVADRSLGGFNNHSPHPLGSGKKLSEGDFYQAIYNSPFIDAYVEQFSEQLIRSEWLGCDSTVDFLGLSFSALDTVGHEFGPNSVEIFDTLRRLDLTLGKLFDFLDTVVGKDHYLLGFTSDHGVLPLPEYAGDHLGVIAKRLSAEESACLHQSKMQIEKELQAPGLLLAEIEPNLYLDPQIVTRLAKKQKEIDSVVVSHLIKCAVIRKVWTKSELSNEQENKDLPAALLPYQELYRNNFFESRSGDYLIQFQEGVLTKPFSGTDHGSPYQYDTHVPLIFSGAGIKHQVFNNKVRIIDLAPTLATLLGISPPPLLDGKVIP